MRLITRVALAAVLFLTFGGLALAQTGTPIPSSKLDTDVQKQAVEQGMMSGYFFWPITLTSVVTLVALSLLEIFVGLLQAFVFVFLTSTFIGMAMHPEH